MEITPRDQGADWTAVMPLIQERQRAFAARAAENDHTVQTGQVRTDVVRSADSFAGARHDPKQSGGTQEGAAQTLQVGSQLDQRHASSAWSDLAGARKAEGDSNTLVKARSDKGDASTDKNDASTDKADEKPPSSQNELSDEAQAVVAEMAARDREVRAHEQAHARVGGQYAGQPTYSYQKGPDGKQYAIGGAVQIDVSPIADDPDATISKMEVVKSAALAPAEPSSADRQVASLADALRAQAIADLSRLRNAERTDTVDRRA